MSVARWSPEPDLMSFLTAGLKLNELHRWLRELAARHFGGGIIGDGFRLAEDCSLVTCDRTCTQTRCQTEVAVLLDCEVLIGVPVTIVVDPIADSFRFVGTLPTDAIIFGASCFGVFTEV